jgi:hypothetical protein
LCTTWLNPKALALLPGFCIAVHLLSVLKAWLGARPRLIVAMNAKTVET